LRSATHYQWLLPSPNATTTYWRPFTTYVIGVPLPGANSFSRERIRQIEAKALRKLRHPSRSRKLKAFVDGVKEM
jgi:hypothetical protein